MEQSLEGMLPTAPHTSSPVELRERVAAERRGTPFLVFRDASGHQQLVELSPAQTRLTVGRGHANDVALPWDTEVSRVHAELQLLGGEWIVVDDGLSHNGSWVNGERVRGRRRICDGDVLRFGRTLMVFASPSARYSDSTSAASSSIPTAQELSPTQRKVLLALCRPFREAGHFATPATNQAIADEVYLSVDAVKTHLRGLFRKFGIEDLPQNQKRAQLVWRAFQTGIVTARDLWPDRDA